MESNYEFKKFTWKTAHVIISMTIKIENFEFHFIFLIDEKSHENVFVFNIS